MLASMRERMWTGTENGSWKHVRRMKTSKYRFSFDKNASSLAALSPDGRLKVWETTNGNMCHDWIPPAGLKATCSCLCWVNSDVGKPSRPKKVKRSSTGSNDSSKYHIVLGTVQGSLLLLNYGLLEVENKLANEHKEKINDVCYNEAKETLYSGSNDKYIIEWSYPSMQLKSKWKADKQSVQKLEVSPDGSCILSAGRTIKLWNAETKQLLQKFTGHASLVMKLLFAPMANGKAFSEECYFLSTSEEDQMINAWHHDPSSEDTNAVCCFMTGSQPVTIDISLRDSQQLKLAVACLDGKISIFTHSLNGRLTKPIDPSLSVQLVKAENEKKAASPIRTFAVKLIEDEDVLMLAYGSPISPTFEKMKLSSLVNGSKVMRETSRGLLHGEPEQAASKQKAKVDKSVVVDANVPMQIDQNRQLATAEGNSTLDKEREELTLGERLTAIGAPKEVLATKGSRKSPRKNREKPNALSLTQMLSQGLHSGDDKLIDNVLYKANKETVINRTVKRLPTSSVITLINKIVERIQRNPSRGYELTIWLRVLMSIHMTYLLSIPNLMNSLSGLYQSLESRTKVYPKLSKLHGRLDLLLTHMSSRQHSTVTASEINESALVVEDKEESDDDDDETDNVDNVEETSLLRDEDDDDDDEDDDVDDDDDDGMGESEGESSDSDEADKEQINEKGKDLSDDESEM